MSYIQESEPYPRGHVRAGAVSVSLQPIVRPWLEHLKDQAARVRMESGYRVSLSQVIEILLRGWGRLPEDVRLEILKDAENLVTKRKWGRPSGKRISRWDSHLPPELQG